VIHERYDIKGSTSANRTAKLPRKGQQLCCRHCNQLYRHREGDNRCYASHWMGEHVPNHSLRDNDLKHR
jgi:hypothetical protein